MTPPSPGASLTSTIVAAMLIAFSFAFGQAAEANQTPICAPQWKIRYLVNASSIGAQPRYYGVYVPPNGPSSMPVVYAFHGKTNNPTNFSRNAALESFADEAGVIVVTPVAQRAPGSQNQLAWYAGDKITTQPGDPLHHDDQDFVEKLLPVIDAAQCTARDRYVMGYSSGAGMTMAMACRLSKAFKAAGAVAAAAFDSSCRTAAVNAPLINIHNSFDQVVPIRASEPNVWSYAQRNGCNGGQFEIDARWKPEIRHAFDCPANQGVVYHRLSIPNPGLGNLGHAWPTEANASENATRVIFEFFGLL